MNRITLGLIFVLIGLLYAVFVIGPAENAAGLKYSLISWEMIAGLSAASWLSVDWLLRKSWWRIPAAVLAASLVTFGLLRLVTVEPLVAVLAVLGMGAIPAAVCSWLSSEKQKESKNK